MKIILDEAKKEGVLIKNDGTEISRYSYKNLVNKDFTIEKFKEEIDNLNKEINPLRKEVVLCKDIIERSKKMEQNLQELSDEKNQEKEVEKNEHIR